MEKINIAEAKSRFSELISRTASGERFIIHRRERPMAVLIATEELERLERSARAAHRLALALGQDESILEKVEKRQLHPSMAAFGLWKDAPELAELAEEISEDRLQSPSRPQIDW